MKKTLLLLVIAVMTTSFKTPVKADKSKIWVVIVGVSKYQNFNVNELQYADKDATAMYEFFKSPHGGSIPEEQIAFLTNEKATRSSILKAVSEKFMMAAENDLVVFYFAGHGTQTTSKKNLYYLNYEADKDHVISTGTSAFEIQSIMEGSRAKMKVWITDACHSGSVGERDGNGGGSYSDIFLDEIGKASAGGFVGIAGAQGSEVSNEDKRFGGGHGAFTYFLLQGLYGEADKSDKQNKDASGDLNGVVSIRELFDYTYRSVVKATGGTQHIALIDKNFNGEFPMSVVSAKGDINQQINKSVIKSGAKYSDLPASTVAVPAPVSNTPRTVGMSKTLCEDIVYNYGQYNFTNMTKRPLLLYYIRTVEFGPDRRTKDVSIKIPPGETRSSSRIPISIKFGVGYGYPALDFVFFFRTDDESNPMYAKMEYTVEACKDVSLTLNDKDMHFSLKEPDKRNLDQ